MKKQYKIIFSDINGCLDHSPYSAGFDPKCIARLAKMAELTEAKIVISSHQVPSDIKDRYLVDILKASGLVEDLLHTHWFAGGDYNKRIAINMWLHKHKGQVSNYVVIDDNEIEGKHPVVYIKDGARKGGILDTHIQEVVNMMNSPLSKPKANLDIKPSSYIGINDDVGDSQIITGFLEWDKNHNNDRGFKDFYSNVDNGRFYL